MRVQIPSPHGEAIDQRMILMKQIMQQFQLLRGEDKRHVDAVLKTLALDPAEYTEYNLGFERGVYYLDLLERIPEAPPEPEASPVVEHKTNGSIAVPAEMREM